VIEVADNCGVYVEGQKLSTGSDYENPWQKAWGAMVLAALNPAPKEAK